MLKDDISDANMVVNELKSAVATKIAKYAVPDQILVSQLHLRGIASLSLSFCFLQMSSNVELLQARVSFYPNIKTAVCGLDFPEWFS